MKYLKIIVVFSAILSIEEISYTSSYYNPSQSRYNSSQVEYAQSEDTPYRDSQPKGNQLTNDWNDVSPNKLGSSSLQTPTAMTQKYQEIIDSWDKSRWISNIKSKQDDMLNFAQAIKNDPQAINILQALIATNSKEIEDELVKMLRIIKLSASQNEVNSAQTDNYLYSKKINGSSPDEVADRLIEESYISPAMQWAILSFFQQPFIINNITNLPVVLDNKKIRNWFTVEDILNNVEPSNLSATSKTTTINAIQAAMQAIDIAVEVAKLEAGYDANKQNYYIYQNADTQITKILYAKKQKLEAMLSRIQTAQIKSSDSAFSYNVQKLDNNDFRMLSIDEVDELILATDFRTKTEHVAAQLLFKESFIAQQHHLKNKTRLENIRQSEHRDENLVYNKFPSMSELVSIAKNMNTKPETHAFLTDIRKAVQTALYIAKKEYQKVYHLSTHPLVQALQNMDDQVKAVWINPQFGATQDDLSRDAMWTNLSNVAIGVGATVGVAAAAGAAYYGYNNPYAVRYAVDQGKEQIGNLSTNIQNKVKETGTAVYTKAEELANDTSKLLERLNPLPQPSNLKIAEYKAQDKLNEVKNWFNPTLNEDGNPIQIPLTEAEKTFNTANYF